MQEAEDLLRWAVDGLRAELGDQKIAAWASKALEVLRNPPLKCVEAMGMCSSLGSTIGVIILLDMAMRKDLQ